MGSITHEAILKAGPYRDVKVSKADAEPAKRLYQFMLRLRLCEEALAREYPPRTRCAARFTSA